ncbi:MULTISPECIES: alpha-E domain-containing protein [unclassified Robiginitalea]|uniref:alpha-E domain-containing protein n=1 Tax=Robiginitalea TaxID=252306 RepID=UPI00234AD13B|nr:MULTISPECIES: alpha-E domain-containing protein [unclassified Robiginitalea]MDC6354190.1 alpha-E domain-containing protein [Robiginitalea sp. PM2]MDC6374457.1 alpha-E domain-containing protein [Robiginitalea sp. SP8]
MLARVADNLFWMGRYIERAEHTARYLNVNYFSSLDAPNSTSQSRDFVMRSMLYMVGEPATDDMNIDEDRVLTRIGMDREFGPSVINSICYARENAHSARDLISTELYESINKFYHFAENYPVKKFVKTGLYEFTSQVTEMTAVLRGKIRGTLLHDSIYAIIMMGVNLERALQITRIINAKYNDAKMSPGSYGDRFRNSYEWTTLLKCAESYDMMRRYYKKTPNSLCTLEFLILNSKCPRSVMNSLNQVYRHVCTLDPLKSRDKDSTAFLVGKVRAEYQFKRVEDIEGNIQQFIEDILSDLSAIGARMENEFFHY